MERKRLITRGTRLVWSGKLRRPRPSTISKPRRWSRAVPTIILPRRRRKNCCMPETQTILAEQFDDIAQQREASTLGMWTFLATEVLFFGGMFLGYVVYRHAYAKAFAAASKHTLVLFGTANTAVLLTSSLTIALAVRAARLNLTKALVRYLLFTAFLGAGFLVLKAFEYSADLHEHLWPGPHFTKELPQQAQIFWFLYC